MRKEKMMIKMMNGEEEIRRERKRNIKSSVERKTSGRSLEREREGNETRIVKSKKKEGKSEEKGLK